MTTNITTAKTIVSDTITNNGVTSTVIYPTKPFLDITPTYSALSQNNASLTEIYPLTHITQITSASTNNKRLTVEKLKIAKNTLAQQLYFANLPLAIESSNDTAPRFARIGLSTTIDDNYILNGLGNIYLDGSMVIKSTMQHQNYITFYTNSEVYDKNKTGTGSTTTDYLLSTPIQSLYIDRDNVFQGYATYNYSATSGSIISDVVGGRIQGPALLLADKLKVSSTPIYDTNPNNFYKGQYDYAPFDFIEYGINENQAEHYYLPKVDITVKNKTSTFRNNYDILTSKKLVTVAQGGTSANNGPDALRNLIGTSAIGGKIHPIYWNGQEFAVGIGIDTKNIDYNQDNAKGIEVNKLGFNSLVGYNPPITSGLQSDAKTLPLAAIYLNDENEATIFYHSNVAIKAISKTSGRSSNPANYEYCLTADRVYNAVWNDYAEYRASKEIIHPGYVVMENGDDTLSTTQIRLSTFAGVVSDTFGSAMGQTTICNTPIAVAGRVLVYPWRDRKKYQPGDCVCAAPNGTVDIMSREEIINYPDRIVGTVSCVPEYETWGTGNVRVDGRIWIKVR